MKTFLKQYTAPFAYALALAILFIFLKVAEYKLLIIDHSFELYAGGIAMLFLLVDIWISRKIFTPQKEIIEKEKIVERTIYIPAATHFVLNKEALAATDLSSRELEVLQLIAKGLSNQEIADQLFLSVSTIKSHVANLFFKLDVLRRTQAVEKGKKLSLIP